jgi:hypothetical protein
LFVGDVVSLDVRIEESDLARKIQLTASTIFEIETYIPSWSNKEQAKATLPRILYDQLNPHLQSRKSI